MSLMQGVACSVLLLLGSSAAQAQAVYVTPGVNGPVFSDKPQSGAKPVALQPLNVLASPPKAAAEPDPGNSFPHTRIRLEHASLRAAGGARPAQFPQPSVFRVFVVLS